MKHLHLSVIIFVIFVQITFGDLVCATWNINLFPSRLWNMRAEVALETATINECARLLQDTLKPLTQTDSADLIFFAQEIRDAESAEKLLKATDIEGLKLDVISNFNDDSGIPIWQQIILASTLKVLESDIVIWRATSMVMPPRGYVYAVYEDKDNGPIACFTLHLKSNLNRSRSELENQRNIYKRELASHQVLDKVKELIKKYGEDLKVVVAGDFNTKVEPAVFIAAVAAMKTAGSTT